MQFGHLTRISTSKEKCRGQCGTITFRDNEDDKGVNKEYPSYFSNFFQASESLRNVPLVDVNTLCHICMNQCIFPLQICLMSKPGDQHGRVTPTPVLSQKVKAFAYV